MNKKKSVISVFAVILTTMMFTTLFTMVQSMSKNMLVMTFGQTGYELQFLLKVRKQDKVSYLKWF